MVDVDTGSPWPFITRTGPQKRLRPRNTIKDPATTILNFTRQAAEQVSGTTLFTLQAPKPQAGSAATLKGHLSVPGGLLRRWQDSLLPTIWLEIIIF